MASGLGLTKANKDKFTFEDFMPKSEAQVKKEQENAPNKFLRQMMMLGAAMGAKTKIQQGS